MRDKVKMNVPYFQVPNDIFDYGLTPNQLAVYFYLCRCGNHGGTAFPSYHKIAQKCGVCKSTAIKTVNLLTNVGLLVKKLRPLKNENNLTNIYEVSLPSVLNTPPSVRDTPGSVPDTPYKEPIYKESSHQELENHNGALSQEQRPAADRIPKISEETKQLVKYYFLHYQHTLGKKHPALKPIQAQRVMREIDKFYIENMVDLDGMVEMVKHHFIGIRSLETDYNINHFATNGVLTNLMYEASY